MGGAFLGPRGGYQKSNFRLLFRDFGRLESGADGEVEGSAGFAVVAGEGAAVFEADGADGEVDADSEAGGEFKIVIEGSGVEEDKAFEGTSEGAGVFSVGDPPAVAAEGGSYRIVGPFGVRGRSGRCWLRRGICEGRWGVHFPRSWYR